MGRGEDSSDGGWFLRTKKGWVIGRGLSGYQRGDIGGLECSLNFENLMFE